MPLQSLSPHAVAVYILKPYINSNAHLAIRNYVDSINHTSDRSCIPRNVLVTLNDCNMSENEVKFKIKRIRGNTYYLMQEKKYLQCLGIFSDSRIIADEDLNNRCRWSLIYVEDVDAFLIVPVSPKSTGIISSFCTIYSTLFLSDKLLIKLVTHSGT